MERIEANAEVCEERKINDGIQFSEMDKMLKDCNRYINECEEVLQDCAKYFENVDETESIFSDEDDSMHEAEKEQSSKRTNDSACGVKQDSCVQNDLVIDGNCVNDVKKSENTIQNMHIGANKDDVFLEPESEELVDKIEEQYKGMVIENVGNFYENNDIGKSSNLINGESNGDSMDTNIENQIADNSCTETDDTDNTSAYSKDDMSEGVSVVGTPGVSSIDKTESKSELNPWDVTHSMKDESEMPESKKNLDDVDNPGQNATGGSDLSTEMKFVESHDSDKDSIQDINNECFQDVLKASSDSNITEGNTMNDFKFFGDKTNNENIDSSVDKSKPQNRYKESNTRIPNDTENIKESVVSTNKEPETKDLLQEGNVFIDENAKMNETSENALIESVKVSLDHLESDDSLEDENQDVKLVPLRISEEFDSEIEKMKSNVVEYVNNKISENSINNDHDKGSGDENRVETNSRSDKNEMESNSKLREGVDIEVEQYVKYKMEGSQTVNEELKTLEWDVEKNKHVADMQSKMEELERELASTKAALKLAHNQLANQQSTMNSTVMTLKLELYKTQTALKHERSKSHQQLTDVISHLMYLEGNLRRGQLKHRKELKTKNETIEIQKTEIMKLRDQNEQLLNAIKEICANGGMNGYMRDKHSHSEKKGNNGKLGMVKDKLLMKNRSSLELNNFNVEKFNVKNQRLCSSQEDLKNLHDDAFEDNSPGHDKGSVFGKSRGTSTRGSKNGNKSHRKNLQNFFTEPEIPKQEMNKSNSDSSQLSESSGVYSMSDQDCPRQTLSGMNGHGHHFEDDDFEDDDDDGRIFSFSSTHINTVIDEEEALGPVVSHSGHMMSMGSMPMLAPVKERTNSNKDRPHSLSSVDLLSIQRQAANLSKSMPNETISETSTTPTPPPSPSYNNNNNNKPDSGKSEMTPFQTFKTMFKRKGSKNKGNKKRSVSLSQTTNMEYTEALKKHFQKFDMQ